MKLEIEIPDSVLDYAFDSPHSRHWCQSFAWNGNALVGAAFDRYERKEVKFDSLSIRNAIRCMLISEHAQVFARVLNETADGIDRDIFLQYVVFGEAKYS